jgi:hypothetical protein
MSYILYVESFYLTAVGCHTLHLFTVLTWPIQSASHQCSGVVIKVTRVVCQMK